MAAAGLIVTGRKDDMTTEPTPATRTGRIATEQRHRKPSAKTLYRLLAQYIKDNNIPRADTVESLVEKLKSSIVAEEVGPSLDVFK